MNVENCWDFVDGFDSLMISSINPDGLPHMSYAPFIEVEGRFFICISAIAFHAQNLKNNPKASIMIIEDESEAKNSFARKRVTFDTNVHYIPRDDRRFLQLMPLFQDKFGEKATIYTTMSDFMLFEFMPYGGRAVFGFGDAYDYKNGEFVPAMGAGHQNTK